MWLMSFNIYSNLRCFLSVVSVSCFIFTSPNPWTTLFCTYHFFFFIRNFFNNFLWLSLPFLLIVMWFTFDVYYMDILNFQFCDITIFSWFIYMSNICNYFTIPCHLSCLTRNLFLSNFITWFITGIIFLWYNLIYPFYNYLSTMITSNSNHIQYIYIGFIYFYHK